MTTLLNFILAHEEFRSARLPSLYSDFRHLRINNPNGFLANCIAWKTALSAASRAGVLRDTLILHTGEELVSSLTTREWGRPLALGTVVDGAVQARDLIPLDLFLRQTESVYYRPWINHWGLLSWGLEMAGLKTRAATNDRLQSGDFVVLKNVEESAKKILSKISTRPNNVPRIFTLSLLTKEFSNPLTSTPYTEPDLSVLLKFLTRDLREASTSGNVVKFKNSNEELTPVTENDITIANLKTMVSSLHTQVDLLAAKIVQSNAKARAALNDKNKTVALAALKSKKIAESTLKMRASSLNQLEEVLDKIEQASDNVEIVTQLQRSTKVLRMLNKQTGGVEKVESVMDELKEQMEGVEEVTKAIAEEGTGAMEDDEVEDELAAMLEEEVTKKEMEEDAARVKELESVAESVAESVNIAKSLGGLTFAEKERDQKENVAVPAS